MHSDLLKAWKSNGLILIVISNGAIFTIELSELEMSLNSSDQILS